MMRQGNNVVADGKDKAVRKRVLVVEDDRDVRFGLKILLQREYDVVEAEDGISAITVAKRERPDVVVLDLGLPGGDGLSVLERMRDMAELAFTPKIVVTGRDGAATDEAALQRGAHLVLHKPADPQQVLDAVKLTVMWPQPQRRHVLVVEDDADLLAAMKIQLHARGLVVSTACDGAGAVGMARHVKPDAIILDLGLPAGDGLAVLERLRSFDELAKTPVVVLTGRDAEPNRELALAAGANAFLNKPAAAEELLMAVGFLS